MRNLKTFCLAGAAGLATAALLAHDGHDVELVEKNDELGGRAGSWDHDGFRFDTGPSWWLMPEVFDHFFEMLGTSTAEQLDLVRLDHADADAGARMKQRRQPRAQAQERARELLERVGLERLDGLTRLRYLTQAGGAIQLSAAQLCAIFSATVTDWSDSSTLIPYLDKNGTQQLQHF